MSTKWVPTIKSDSKSFCFPCSTSSWKVRRAKAKRQDSTSLAASVAYPASKPLATDSPSKSRATMIHLLQTSVKVKMEMLSSTVIKARTTITTDMSKDKDKPCNEAKSRSRNILTFLGETHHSFHLQSGKKSSTCRKAGTIRSAKPLKFWLSFVRPKTQSSTSKIWAKKSTSFKSVKLRTN